MFSFDFPEEPLFPEDLFLPEDLIAPPVYGVYQEDKLGGGGENKGDAAGLSMLRQSYPELGGLIDAYLGGASPESVYSDLSQETLNSLCNLYFVVFQFVPPLAVFLAAVCHVATRLKSDRFCSDDFYYHEELGRCVHDDYMQACFNGFGFFDMNGVCQLCSGDLSRLSKSPTHYDDVLRECVEGCPPHMMENYRWGCVVAGYNQPCTTESGAAGVVGPYGSCENAESEYGCGPGERYDFDAESCMPTDDPACPEGSEKFWVAGVGYQCLPPCGHFQRRSPLDGHCICDQGARRSVPGDESSPCMPENECDPPRRADDRWGCVEPGYNTPCELENGQRGTIAPNGKCVADNCPEGYHFDYDTDTCQPDGVDPDGCSSYGPFVYPWTGPDGVPVCIECYPNEELDQPSGYCVCRRGLRRQDPSDPSSPCVPIDCSEYGPDAYPWTQGNVTTCVTCRSDEVFRDGFCYCDIGLTRQNQKDPNSPCIQEIQSTGGAEPVGRQSLLSSDPVPVPRVLRPSGTRSAIAAPTQCALPSIYDPIARMCVTPDAVPPAPPDEEPSSSGPSGWALLAGTLIALAAVGIFSATLSVDGRSAKVPAPPRPVPPQPEPLPVGSRTRLANPVKKAKASASRKLTSPYPEQLPAGARVPLVDFSKQDLQDSSRVVTPESIARDYGSPERQVRAVVRAYIPIHEVPDPRLVEEEEFDEGGGYDWSELQLSRGRAVPPPKLLLEEGRLFILDGNHRIAWWTRGDSRYTHIPVWLLIESA